jgi:hypothetical protein
MGEYVGFALFLIIINEARARTHFINFLHAHLIENRSGIPMGSRLGFHRVPAGKMSGFFEIPLGSQPYSSEIPTDPGGIPGRSRRGKMSGFFEIRNYKKVDLCLICF